VSEPGHAPPLTSRHRLAVAAACLLVAVTAGAHLDQLFLGGHLGYAGALRGVIGRNYLRYDLAETRGAPVQNAGPTAGDAPSVRFNHPPLSNMLVGLAYGVAGPSRWAARLVPLAASVLTVPLLFGFLRRLWDPTVAAVGVLLWALSPFVAIYGAMVSYEPLVLLAWSALLWAWARFRIDGSLQRGPLVVAGVAVAAGVWTDWPMVALASGVAAAEAAAVLVARPRRPWLLAVVVGSLVVALGALAAYYLLVLDVDGGRLESLYRFRSSVGRWEPVDVAAHIAHRTAVLLTWPLVVAGIAGVLWTVVGRPGRPNAAPPGGRTLVLVGLVAAPVALLVALPQHAVIHCFSAWYLLPAAVAGAAAAVVGGGRALRGKAGPWPVAAGGAILGALFLWQAAPVTADGWISDGSPLEGRPRLAYEHLVVAEWARHQTGPEDRLVVDPSTGTVGIRAWYHHDRRSRRLGRREQPEVAVASTRAKLALFDWDRLGPRRARTLLERHGGTVVDRVVAVEPAARREDIVVLELREEAPGPLWPWWGSASYPPHRLLRAEGRTAAYQAELRGEAGAAPSGPPPPGSSLAELAARHLLARGGPAEARTEAALIEALDVRTSLPLCQRFEWVGARARPSPAGRVGVEVVLRASGPGADSPRLRGRLRGPATTGLFQLVADDGFSHDEGTFVVASHRLDGHLPAGRYVVELAGCGDTLESEEIDLEPRTLLPVHPLVGRL